MRSCVRYTYRSVFGQGEEQKAVGRIANYRVGNITKVGHRCNDVVLAKLGIKKSDRGIQVRQFNRLNRK